MKSFRVPQFRIDTLSRCEDIKRGEATIIAGEQAGVEGWFLPGQQFTRNRKAAEKACEEIAAIMALNGGTKRAA